MGNLQIFYSTGIVVHKRISIAKALKKIADMNIDYSWRFIAKDTITTHGLVKCSPLCKGRWNKGCYLCTVSGMGKHTPKEIINLIN
jgi:hypothetical protein